MADSDSDPAGRDGPPPETEEAIMRATYRAFCEHGYVDLTMRDIAAQFPKSRSLLHYHYETKEELIVALLTYLLDEHPARTAIADIAEPERRLTHFLDRGLFGPEGGDRDGNRNGNERENERENGSETGNGEFDFFEFHAALLELRSYGHRNDAYREQLDRNFRFVTDLMEGTIREGVEAGVFRPVDARATAIFLHDIVDAARIRRVTLGHDDAPREARWAIETFVLPTLRAPDGGDGDENDGGDRNDGDTR